MSQLTYSTSILSLSLDVPILPDDLKELTEFFRAFITLDYILLFGDDEQVLDPQESDRIRFAITEAFIFILDSDSKLIIMYSILIHSLFFQLPQLVLSKLIT